MTSDRRAHETTPEGRMVHKQNEQSLFEVAKATKC